MSGRPARAGRTLSAELPPELLEAVKAAADAQGMTLAAWLRRTLAAAVATAPAAADPGPALADRLAAIEARLAALERNGRRGRL